MKTVITHVSTTVHWVGVEISNDQYFEIEKLPMLKVGRVIRFFNYELILSFFSILTLELFDNFPNVIFFEFFKFF